MGWLDKLRNKGKAAASRIENKDLMEAIVGGCLLIAAADGEIEPEEIENLNKQIAANPSLAHFGSDITAAMRRFDGMLDAGYRIGKVNILREIEDVKSNPKEAEDVLMAMLTVAESDGEIEPEELTVLKEVATRLGLRLSDYGIE